MRSREVCLVGSEGPMAVALLRGINVGGKGKLPMRDLSAIFSECGATEVKTYIQSGNVVFKSADPKVCVASVTKTIAAKYGYPGRIVLRSGAEMKACYAGNPFLKVGVAETALHVYFLADEPDAAGVKGLDAGRSAPDKFVVRGREIYLSLPGGMARTKLTNAYFDSRLKTFCTARNWGTIAKLAGMCEEG